MTTQAAPTTYYIHEVYREDLSDPESPVTWYEYRVGKSTTQPEYYESIAGGDGEAGLASAFRYIKLVGGVAVVLWDGELSKD